MHSNNGIIIFFEGLLAPFSFRCLFARKNSLFFLLQQTEVNLFNRRKARNVRQLCLTNYVDEKCGTHNVKRFDHFTFIQPLIYTARMYTFFRRLLHFQFHSVYLRTFYCQSRVRYKQVVFVNRCVTIKQ